MKTVVISDIHNHTDSAQMVLDKVDADEYVILGDVFDDFDDTPEDVYAVAKWLSDTVKRDDVTVLFGNHDMPYRFSNPTVWCPGFSDEKSRAINSAMSLDDWDKLQFYKYTQGWYLSHAGLHPDVFGHPLHGITPESIDTEIEKGLTHLMAGERAQFCRYGHRMGIRSYGGITWADWNSEFVPIVGINQIVGHTPHSCVRAKYIIANDKLKSHHHCVYQLLDPKPLSYYDSYNLCIDTQSDHYAIIEDGEVRVEDRWDLVDDDI
jgi:hypothetical protein